MNWKISILYIVLVFSACKQIESTESTAVSSSYLIEADDLVPLAKLKTTKILDFRKEKAYKNEHIAGAVHIWRTDLEDSTYAYNGMKASSMQIELLFGSLGIKTDDVLVIYDDNGLCDASRLWWLLQNYNYTKVKLLHGGINAWKANGGTVSKEIPKVTRTIFKLTDNPAMNYTISKDEVVKAIDNNTKVLDTRTSDEFTGKYKKDGAKKAGRISKSVHIDWAEAIDYNGDQRFKSIEELEKIYGRLNISKDDPLIVYCHSGVRSAHTSFVLTQLLGYENVKNYDGSWVEWSHFDSLPFQQDSITTLK
jgi:thiosulfate/3-mercaptopyruvate sulfurtransferase